MAHTIPSWASQPCIMGPMVYACAYCPLNYQDTLGTLEFDVPFTQVLIYASNFVEFPSLEVVKAWRTHYELVAKESKLEKFSFIETMIMLIYEKLPRDIVDRHILLLDPVLATSNSAVQAIELLLRKGVLEERIIFRNLISAPEGIHAVCKRFPLLKIVTSEIDSGLNEEYCVVPGMGEFGDRYFETDDENAPHNLLSVKDRKVPHCAT